MAQHLRRRSGGRKPKGEDSAAEFFASLPDDQNWMEALRDEFQDDEVGEPDDVDAVKTLSTDEWAAVQDLLEEQGSAILALQANVELLEESLADLAGREPPVPGPPVALAQATVRDVVRTLQQQAADVAARLRSRPEQPRHP